MFRADYWKCLLKNSNCPCLTFDLFFDRTLITIRRARSDDTLKWQPTCKNIAVEPRPANNCFDKSQDGSQTYGNDYGRERFLYKIFERDFYQPVTTHSLTPLKLTIGRQLLQTMCRGRMLCVSGNDFG